MILHEEPHILREFHANRILAQCEKQFGVKWDDGIAFAYNEAIYCKNQLTPDVIVHEYVHIRQQKELGAVKWWKKYFSDPAFRLEQETEAYLEQAKYLRRVLKDRNQLYACIREVATDFSHPAYGPMLSMDDAMRLLL